jgi:hypothetical protein
MILFTQMRLFPHLHTALFCCVAMTILAGCTTIQNRRDLYFPQTVQGPYTRMIHHRLSVPSPTPAQLPKGSAGGRSGSGKNVIKPRG